MSVNEKMTAIADAIRGKTGKTEKLTLDQMPGEIAGLGQGGTTDHNQLSNRDAADQHPIEAITGLKEILDKVEAGSGGNVDQSGLSDVQTILRNMMTIIRAQVEDADGTPQAYNIDVSSLAAECDTLIAGLTGSGGDVDPDEPVVVTYTVTAELVNVTSSNKATAVNENTSYTTTMTAADGYNLDSVRVIMGGVDITATAYANGVISIPAVTGDVEILATASVAESEAELITDGLLAYFDFRTAEYNNADTGGSTTISATQGEGHTFAWAKNGVAVQDERGIHFANTRKNEYSRAGNTTATDIGSTMTLVMLTYGHVMSQGFNLENLGASWRFIPEYNTTGGSKAYAESRGSSDFNLDNKDDYNFCVYRVDGYTLTEIMDTSKTIYNGGDIDGFASWVTTVGIGMIGQTNNGTYCTAAAIYNRALSDVEIEEMRAFMKTLEVA